MQGCGNLPRAARHGRCRGWSGCSRQKGLPRNGPTDKPVTAQGAQYPSNAICESRNTAGKRVCRWMAVPWHARTPSKTMHYYVDKISTSDGLQRNACPSPLSPPSPPFTPWGWLHEMVAATGDSRGWPRQKSTQDQLCLSPSSMEGT